MRPIKPHRLHRYANTAQKPFVSNYNQCPNIAQQICYRKKKARAFNQVNDGSGMTLIIMLIFSFLVLYDTNKSNSMRFFSPLLVFLARL